MTALNADQRARLATTTWLLVRLDPMLPIARRVAILHAAEMLPGVGEVYPADTLTVLANLERLLKVRPT